jgi:hypothetical protein
MKAADLPDGSIVANENKAFIKNRPTRDSQWRGTDGSYARDWFIDDLLAEGAVVLREGAR